MKPRGGGGGGAAAASTPSRTRPGGVWSVFEDFKPMSEWQQDHESHNLIIYLPGFMKEQLRISTERGNIIRVRGERLISGSKWSRFLEDFPIPENSELNSTRAKFQGGILTITIPKKVVDETSEPQKTEQIEEINSELDEKHIAGDEVIKKSAEKEEKKSERSKELAEERGKESKGKQIVHSSSGLRGSASLTMERCKKAVKGVVELDEDRQLLINMGVAVLVVVAISAYATYKYASRED